MRWFVLILVLLLAGCSASESPETGSIPSEIDFGKIVGGTTGGAADASTGDYLVVERHRFLDEQGFDRPVEAFSMLFPKGWQIDGGVRWLSLDKCRGEIVSNQIKAASPDGSIRYEVAPVRSFSWADEPAMMQAMRAGAQAGGCQLSQPFDAPRFITKYGGELGASVSDIRPDEGQAAMIQQLDTQANASSRQYGTGTQQSTTMSFGKLTWPNGEEGLLHVGVTNMITRKPDMLTGGSVTFSVTSVFYNVMMRYPAARREEAAKLYGMVQTSFRQNPIWKQAHDRFFTELGNMEHAARMERIRLMGEQSRAYARAASEASDQRMRDWESQQASQDRQHRGFVQTIREVETWRDASGPVELSSGYGQAWSRGDGTYVLSNSPNFDPNRAFQEQRWEEMKRADP